jgi:uncharacterized phage protein gp47/JayE
MAFKKPTLNEISEKIKNDIVAKTGIGNPLKNSFIYAISYALGGACLLMHYRLEYFSKQILPDSADEEHLERWSSIWGVNRKPASFSERDVNLTGTNGAVIPVSSLLQNDEGYTFETTEEIVFTMSTTIVHVVATEPGKESNVLAGSKLAFQSPVPGVESEALVLATGYIDGEAQESDEELRARLLTRIQRPPAGGKKSDYIQWALEVPGITRAFVYPSWLGEGTVGIAVVTDNADSLIPDVAKVSEVQNYIDNLKPVTAKPTVFAPIESVVSMTIQINPNTSDVQASITSELEDLFSRESEPGGRILISHIREAISTAIGESDNFVVNPSTDIQAASGEIKTLGAITYQTLVYNE